MKRHVTACLFLLSTLLLIAPEMALADEGDSRSEITIPTLDISQETDRHVVIAQGTPTTYQGHPTTLLMPDNQTIYCVWTLNHGGPCGPMKRSDDAGRTWSDLLPVPKNWSDTENCPAIYRLIDPEGKARLFVFTGRGDKVLMPERDGQMHSAYSEDGGKTWTEMRPTGLRTVMPLTSIVPIEGGKRYLGMTNIRRPGETKEKMSNVLAQTYSDDGGLSWSPWEVVLDIAGSKLGEPCLIRSPDGKQLLCVIRDNNRDRNSWMMTTDDEGRTWSKPRQLSAAVTGDRHDATYTSDGRLFIAFRDVAKASPTRTHFVGWVGTYDDLLHCREGQYRVKLLHSYARGDCGYAAVERLPDDTLLATTYIKYRPGRNKQSVVSVRFTLDELDAKLPRAAKP